jgi:ribosomal protein L2
MRLVDSDLIRSDRFVKANVLLVKFSEGEENLLLDLDEIQHTDFVCSGRSELN